MDIDKKKILKFVSDEARRPVLPQELLRHFKIDQGRRKEMKKILEKMVHGGDLIKIKGGRFGVPSKMNLVTGKLQNHPDGYGFVLPEEGGVDIYVHGRNFRDAMHGDRVVVRVDRVKSPGKKEGAIVRVLERAHKTVVGKYEAGRRFGYVVPVEERIFHDIYVSSGNEGGAEDGDIVVVEITEYPTKSRNPEGVVIQVIGSPDDPEVEIQTIIANHGLAVQFPEEVMAESNGIPEDVTSGDISERVDLRDLAAITIDGETARDFDDAVFVERDKNGVIKLWVSIADVSNYVKEGSPLDREAYERGTSVYFPDRCIPMLPERLSNNVCSLIPGVDRLTLTAEMEFDKSGKCVNSSFYTSVIRSSFRLTYTEVSGILEHDEEDLKKKYRIILPDLKIMEELCGRLRTYRRQRGCIDFDLPEAQIILDIQGGVESIVRSERNLAHMIIEEFMLAANEAVASFLTANKIPVLYRVHEEPDEEKIYDFIEFISNMGYQLSFDKPLSWEIQRILNEASGKREGKVINHILLRAMKQAEYSADNRGHFGLASKEYCHFTSPIRRYPDLVVHRILKEFIGSGDMKKSDRAKLMERLPATGRDMSERERKAVEAERDVVDLKKVQFMSDKVGEEFAGIITGVASFGFFVELEQYLVEGLVHVSSLCDDYYCYDDKGHSLTGERTKRSFRIGDEVTVRVEKVDPAGRRIDFNLLS